MKKTISETFDQHWILDPVTGCHVWQRARKGKEAAGGGGYGCFRVKGHMIAAHRFAWELVHGPIPAGMHILHSCDNTKCVNETHLIIGTNEQNQADKARKLRAPARLTPNNIQTIRRRVAVGEFQRIVAADFKLAQGDVSHICSRNYWKHVA